MNQLTDISGRLVYIVMLWRANSMPQVVGVYSSQEYANERIREEEDNDNYYNMWVVERDINPDFGPYGKDQSNPS